MGEVIQFPRAKHYFSAGASRVREVCRLAYLFATELAADHPVEIIVRPVKSRRTLIQNAKMWAMLADVARQVPWPVNGIMQTLDAEDWKALITAATRQEIRMAAGLSGGVVMLGVSTRKMTVAEMGDVIEYLYAFGAEKGVVWGKQAQQEVPEEWEQAA